MEWEGREGEREREREKERVSSEGQRPRRRERRSLARARVEGGRGGFFSPSLWRWDWRLLRQHSTVQTKRR